jgi:hypothetical protein
LNSKLIFSCSGEGLGKNKEGNIKHIAVSVKNDKKGVGVNQGQWEFAWWDHLYNKSASSVTVEKDETKGEIKIASKSKTETRRSKTGIISTQKPTGKTVKAVEENTNSGSMTSMADARNMMDSVKDIHVNMAQRVATASLYGSFVKSATTSAAPTPGASDEEKEEVDDELKDYSIKVTDAELFAACEGRTARKGGRGLVDQTGKFKRVMQDFLRPVDEDEVAVVDTKKKRKHSNDDSEEKSAKKAKKEAKAAKKAEKEAKKQAKAAKKAEKEAKKAEKEAKKTEKEAKKAEKEAKKLAKKEKKNKTD